MYQGDWVVNEVVFINSQIVLNEAGQSPRNKEKEQEAQTTWAYGSPHAKNWHVLYEIYKRTRKI